jgi:hypothetical protein
MIPISAPATISHGIELETQEQEQADKGDEDG